MEGSLTPEQQLKILSMIWGNDREGFVFLPWISGKASNKAERRSSFHEGQPFVWPDDKPKILEHLGKHETDDVYFAPCLFDDNRRVEQYAAPERALWADLDPVNPENVDSDYRPTIAWESSPGRYQAVWLLSHPRVGASWAGKENHRLTMYVGADPSGWDTTQLLRVPGRMNHKPDHRAANAGQAVPGRLLWSNGPRYTPDDFDALPEIAEVLGGNEADLLDDALLASVDRHAVWGRVRLKVSAKCREYVGVRKMSDVAGADRSSILWQIERDLADAGCSLAEIVAVVKPLIWNKYAGRNDEIKRLKLEAAKALGTKGEAEEDDGAFGDVLEGDTGEKPELRWLSSAMSVAIPRPKWLIKNVWSRGGCGFISGDPKSFKSWMALDMAVSVATGRPFLNDEQYSVVGGPQPVLYLQEEDGEIIVRARLEQIIEGKVPELHWHGGMTMDDEGVYWNPPHVDIPLGFHVRSGFTASDPGWQAWLTDIVHEGQFAMTIVDTLGTTAGDVDTDRAPDLMSKILRPLKYIAEDTGCAMAVVHHNKKGTDGGMRGGARMLGSVALHAWVDDALYVYGRESLVGGKARVTIDRESKSSVDSRWQLEIPRMAVHTRVIQESLVDVGERTVWCPVTGLVPTPEATEEKSSPSAGPAYDAPPPAGTRIANQIMTMMSSSGWVPKARVDEALGINKEKMKQINAAIANGLLLWDDEKGFGRP